MKVFLLILLHLFWVLPAMAQREAENWYFGKNAGLNFSQEEPVALTNGLMEQVEGCATISDAKTGQLLFYTNGIEVWNRQHELMPNGYDLLSHQSATQAALIVPFPNHPQQYYLFTINATINFSVPPGLTYSVVNMELQNGLGDVVPETKNSRLLDLTGEQLTAVPHINRKDYWIITHGSYNNEFYVFLLTQNGISSPSVYKIGSIAQEPYWHTDIGYLKASPNGKKLAYAVFSEQAVPFEIFDFNPTTGHISNAVSLGNFPSQYGVSFSPDNSKLYLSTSNVIQFDLSQPTKEAIIISQTEITPIRPNGVRHALQLGPDGRLYNPMYPQRNRNSFYVINNPNQAGIACEPVLKEFDFRGGYVHQGLPNFMQSYFNGLEPGGNKVDCNADNAITISPNPTTGAFKISINTACYEAKTVKLINSIGQLCAFRQINEMMVDFDIRTLAAGLYILQITTTTGEVIKKVVKI